MTYIFSAGSTINKPELCATHWFPNSQISQQLFINKSTLSIPNNQIEGALLMRQSPSNLSETAYPIPFFSSVPQPLWENKVFCCFYSFLSGEMYITNGNTVRTCVWMHNPCTTNRFRSICMSTNRWMWREGDHHSAGLKKWQCTVTDIIIFCFFLNVLQLKNLF